jgi:hypothetical protein
MKTSGNTLYGCEIFLPILQAEWFSRVVSIFALYVQGLGLFLSTKLVILRFLEVFLIASRKLLCSAFTICLKSFSSLFVFIQHVCIQENFDK